MNIEDLTRENSELIKQAMRVLVDEKKKADAEHLR